MSVTVEFKVKDTGTAALDERMQTLDPARLAPRVGAAVQLLWQRHFLTLGPNKRGWPTTNFWPGAARATSWAPTPDGVRITVNQIGGRQRYYGGTISAVRARALTIPISPDAYGKRASEFTGLFLLKTKRGAYLVRYADQVSSSGSSGKRRCKGNEGKRARAALQFLFKLQASVTQAADPNVLPEPSVTMGTAKQAVLDAIGRLQ